jgi:hypothetical protein
MNMKTLLAVSFTTNVGLLCALVFVLILFFRVPLFTGPSVIYPLVICPDKAKAAVVEKPSVPAYDRE